MSRSLERIWAADGPAAWALTPLSWLFRGVTALRNALYDWRILRAQPLGLPTISVGNLSVGGTGKTPLAAWMAAELRARGARPAILLRGYGHDEPLVHRRLNPDVPVVANADRVAGAAAARAQGATVLVLDDAFQHRRAARDVDVVLVAAEQRAAHRLLPAGPLREGRHAVRRADLVIVTRKSATLAEAEEAAAGWSAFAGAPPTAIVALQPGALLPAGAGGAGGAVSGVGGAPGEARALSTLAGRRVLAISAIGDPAAFEAQLSAAGASVVSSAFPDHHPFTSADVQALVGRAGQVEEFVCTLKDAVKLSACWPPSAPRLWYLSQAVVVERGHEALRTAFARLLHGF